VDCFVCKLYSDTLLASSQQARVPTWPTTSSTTSPSLPLISMDPIPPELFFVFSPLGAGQAWRVAPESTSVVNVAVHGWRRWFLHPPDRADHSSVPVLLYAANVLNRLSPRARPLQCDQDGGDVLFVPRQWSSSWLALETGVGYEVRFKSPLDRY
jgi:hypothetical protein